MARILAAIICTYSLILHINAISAVPIDGYPLNYIANPNAFVVCFKFFIYFITSRAVAEKFRSGGNAASLTASTALPSLHF